MNMEVDGGYCQIYCQYIYFLQYYLNSKFLLKIILNHKTLLKKLKDLPMSEKQGVGSSIVPPTTIVPKLNAD